MQFTLHCPCYFLLIIAPFLSKVLLLTDALLTHKKFEPQFYPIRYLRTFLRICRFRWFSVLERLEFVDSSTRLEAGHNNSFIRTKQSTVVNPKSASYKFHKQHPLRIRLMKLFPFTWRFFILLRPTVSSEILYNLQLDQFLNNAYSFLIASPLVLNLWHLPVNCR